MWWKECLKLRDVVYMVKRKKVEEAREGEKSKRVEE